jgi:hypothetical protein
VSHDSGAESDIFVLSFGSLVAMLLAWLGILGLYRFFVLAASVTWEFKGERNERAREESRELQGVAPPRDRNDAGGPRPE